MRAAAITPIQGRLLRGWRRESWDEYRSGLAEPAPAGELIARLEAADLRGRGGAGFPVATKWRGVAERGGVPVVVANGEEGEPASVKDRYLLRFRPHAVLDGLLLAQRTLGADRAVVFLADAGGEASVRQACSERPDAAAVEIVSVAHEYVAGEETAVVQAVDGGPALPKAKPPRPYEAGVEGRPTLIQNVETLAYVAWLARREQGEPDSNSFLATITGACAAPGLYELRYGGSVGEALAAAGADVESCRGVLMGGYFGGLMNSRVFELPLDYDALRAAGTGLGCAAFIVLGPDHCPLGTAAAVVRFLAAASSGQCGTCVNGSAAMAAALERLRDGEALDQDVEKLERWAGSLKGRGACGLIDGAAHQVAALFREFPEEIARHDRGETCDRCQGFDHDAWIGPEVAELLRAEDDWRKR